MRSPEEIALDLANARAALTAALTAQSYSIDTGQGKQSVTRASLKDLRAMVRDLENELAAVDAGNVVGEFRRFV